MTDLLTGNDSSNLNRQCSDKHSPSVKSPAIISLGEVLWDLFPEGARFGGAPANFACHAAALGGEVTMVSAVGEDDRGAEAIEILRGYGIDVSLIQQLLGVPTGTVGVEVDAKGKPTFTIHEGSAWDQLPWTDELEARIPRANAVYFGTLGQRGEKARQTIRRALTVASETGVPRVLDINLRPPFYDAEMLRESIEQASILKLSDDEHEEVCAACDVATLQQLLEKFALDLVIMTRGADGALLVTATETYDQLGIPTTVRDTVGAGDSFTAAFLLGLLRKAPFETILHDACATAAEVCAHPGAVPPKSCP